MRIAIWKTGHEIADTVADALSEGFNAEIRQTGIHGVQEGNCNIAYGILRGTESIFRSSEHWFNIDRGYFNPGHFDGYYRISYRGTQARWREGIPRKSWHGKLEPIRAIEKYGHVLICPPTEAVCEFFSINQFKWITDKRNELLALDKTITIRSKDGSDKSPIEFDRYQAVITFNSSVGWKALQMGIPVLSDVNHSIIGSHYGIDDLHKLTMFLQNSCDSRRELFEAMNAHQFTLEEIRRGEAWPLINHYMSTSVTTTGNQ